MTAQSVHLDLVQAASWLPWAFVALDRLAHRPEGKSAAPWVALLAAALGLMILSGAVEPILDGGIVLALYALWLAWRTPGRRRWHVLVGSVAGVVVAAAVAAAQLLPGAAFQAQSQRAMHTYTFFSSGSMNKSFTILGFDPLILGGSHRVPFGFIGTFNLPEISSYIGILPVMALFGLLARRHRRARSRPMVDLVRRPRRRSLPGLGRLHPGGPPRLRHPPLQPPAPLQPQPPRGRPGPGRHLRHLDRPHVHTADRRRPGPAGSGRRRWRACGRRRCR